MTGHRNDNIKPSARRLRAAASVGLLPLLFFFLFSQTALSIHLASVPHYDSLGRLTAFSVAARTARHPQPTARPIPPLNDPDRHPGHAPHSASDHQVYLHAFTALAAPGLPPEAAMERVACVEPLGAIHPNAAPHPRTRAPPIPSLV